MMRGMRRIRAPKQLLIMVNMVWERPLEVAVHTENKGDCQVIVAAGGEKGDAGFYDGGVLGRRRLS